MPDLFAKRATVPRGLGRTGLHRPMTARGGGALLPGNRPGGLPIAQLDSGGLTDELRVSLSVVFTLTQSL